MASGSRKARQRTMLRGTLAVAAGLHLIVALVCCLPWSTVVGLCDKLSIEAPPEQQSTTLMVRGIAALAAWVGVLLLLPVLNPRRYTGVIDVSIGMLVVLALVVALLGSHLKVAPALYLTGTMIYGLLATLLGALRGAASYRAY